jgi:DNA invertase Pin-like site-specific DNA recombinase
MNRPLRALGYTRVSTADQVDGFSLDCQEERIRRWCTDKGIGLAAIYRDGGRSGRDLEREAFRELQGHLERDGSITHVIIVKLDRFSRSLRDSVALIQEWQERGIGIIAIDDGLTDLRKTNALLAHILAWVAEGEHRRIISRVQPGLVARVEAGLPPSQVPWGYRIEQSPGNPRGRLVIDAAIRPVVEDAFAMAARPRYGAGRITRRLEERHRGLLLSVGIERLTRGRIQRMLANPVYTGVLAARIGDRNLVRYDNHPALVDEVTFEAVQRQRGERGREMSRGRAGHNAKSFLGNLIHCGRCGALMSLVGGKGTGTYQCNSRLRTKGFCGMPPVDAGLIDIQAVRQLADALALLWRKIHRDWVTAATGAGADLDSVRSRARQTVDGHDARVAEAIDRLEAGHLDEAGFHRRIAALDERRDAARRLLDTGEVWNWLLRLFCQDEDGSWREHLLEDGSVLLLMPLGVLVALANQEGHWRRLAAAAIKRLEIVEGEQPLLVGEWSDDPVDYADLARLQGEAFARGLLIDVRLNLRKMGYRRLRYLEDGRESWRLENCPTDIIIGPSADDPRGYLIEMRPNGAWGGDLDPARAPLRVPDPQGGRQPRPSASHRASFIGTPVADASAR